MTPETCYEPCRQSSKLAVHEERLDTLETNFSRIDGKLDNLLLGVILALIAGIVTLIATLVK